MDESCCFGVDKAEFWRNFVCDTLFGFGFCDCDLILCCVLLVVWIFVFVRLGCDFGFDVRRGLIFGFW